MPGEYGRSADCNCVCGGLWQGTHCQTCDTSNVTGRLKCHDRGVPTLHNHNYTADDGSVRVLQDCICTCDNPAQFSGDHCEIEHVSN